MTSNLRVNFIFLLFLSIFAVIVIKLFTIQVLNHEDYATRANKQFKKRVELPAVRGLIYDRNMNKLAYNIRSYDVKLEINPFYRLPPDTLKLRIEQIASHLNLSLRNVNDRIVSAKKRKRHTILLKRQISEKKWAILDEINIPGLYADAKQGRNYHSLGNNFQGTTDTDNKGIAGLEYQFDSYLRGENGFQFVQKDGRGNRFSHIDYTTKKPVNGNHLQLTIDTYHQSILEKELELGMSKYNPKSISGIIMDPFTGEIKAMASFPKYETQGEKQSMSRNRVITDAYEPGSTFKIVTAAAVLEEELMSVNELIFCENGKYKFAHRYYRDDNHKYAYLTFRQVIEKSSNIGTIKLAEKLEETHLFRYIRDFGFGARTGLGLQGEATGILRKPDDWSKTSLPSISIGHEVSTSVLQMAQAYSVIANGGILVRPRMIKSKLSSENELISKTETDQVRRVISKSTADTVKSFLRSVVKRGTAAKIYTKDLEIAGKTGTAQKINPRTKTYDRESKVFASFAGFFPFDNPKYVCIISVDAPNYKRGNYGSTTAAPIFKRIATNLMSTIEKEGFGEYLTSNESFVYVPDFVGMKSIDAKKILEEKKLSYDFIGNGNFVVSQSPKKGLYEFDEISRIDLRVDNPKDKIMPNLIGLTVREAIFKLNYFRINIKIVGSGIIKKQSIRSKTIIKDQVSLILTCK